MLVVILSKLRCVVPGGKFLNLEVQPRTNTSCCQSSLFYFSCVVEFHLEFCGRLCLLPSRVQPRTPGYESFVRFRVFPAKLKKHNSKSESCAWCTVRFKDQKRRHNLHHPATNLHYITHNKQEETQERRKSYIREVKSVLIMNSN